LTDETVPLGALLIIPDTIVKNDAVLVFFHVWWVVVVRLVLAPFVVVRETGSWYNRVQSI